MPLTPGELGLTGMAIGALAFVSRGLMDLLKARSEGADHAKICAILGRIETRLKSLDEKHEDPNSKFATVEIAKTLQEMRLEIAGRGQ